MIDILTIEGLTKRFDGLTVVNNLSMRLKMGSIYSIIGPNGAGKTTLFNLISGFLTPDEGRIFFKGRDVTMLPSWKRASLGIGRLFQDIRVFRKLTVYENLLVALKENSKGQFNSMFRRKNGTGRIEDKDILYWLDFVGLLDKKDTPAEALSWGQQKLLSLARLLCVEFEIFLLDEPISGVNPEMIEVILDRILKIKEMGKTVVVVEHNIEAIKSVTDYMYFMDSGRVMAEGAPEEILSNDEIIRLYIGI